MDGSGRANAATRAGGCLTRSSLHGPFLHLEPRAVDVTAGAVSAARHQIREPDFIDLRQIDRLTRPCRRVLRRTIGPLRDDAVDVEFHPALRGEHELRFEKS